MIQIAVLPTGSRGIAIALFLALVVPTASFAQDPTDEDSAYFLYGAGLDFGDLTDRRPHPDTLWMRNPGATPFVVENVRTSCGCTIADWPAAPIAPGARFAIPLTFTCRRDGYTVKKVEIWVSGRRRALRAAVAADCLIESGS